MSEMERPHTSRQVPERLRIPLGPGSALTIDCLRPEAGAPRPATEPDDLPPMPPPEPAGPSTPTPAPLAPPPPFAGPAMVHQVLLAVVEAVPTGGEEFVSAAAASLQAQGRRVAIVSLDKQNRLATRFGRAPAPAWLWTQASPELFGPGAGPLVVPGPASEAEVNAEAVDRVITTLLPLVDVTLVDLGCRWDPRMFRSVLFHATEIVMLTRSGQWSGAEMRLEQAELSGWTDMRKLRLVVVGASPPPPGMLGAAVSALIPEPGGQEAQAFVIREVGRLQR